MSLSTWARDLEKKHDVKAIEQETYERISSGVVMVDHLTGGGWAKNKINEVFGWQGAGKTTTSLQTAAWVQHNLGKAVLYIDAEHSLNLPYARALGVDLDPDRFLLVQKNDSEMVGNIMKSALLNAAKNNLGLIILDSAAAITTGVSDPDAPKSEQVKHAIAERARFWSEILTEITSLVSVHQVTLLFVNQVRQNINAMKYAREDDKEHPTGGNALEFYKVMSVKMEATKIMTEKAKDPLTGANIDEVVGNWVDIKVKKDKATGNTGARQSAYVAKGKGFDNTKTAALILFQQGVFRKEGQGTVVAMEDGKEVKTSDIETWIPKNKEFVNLKLRGFGFQHDYEYR